MVESAAAAAAVLRDLAIPSLVLLAMAALSSVVRRQGIATLGLRRFTGWKLVGTVFALTVLWSAFQLSVTMPIANHLSGRTQDLSAFDDLDRNAGKLAAFLVLGWLLGAFTEELAYRGYLLTRLGEAFGSGRTGLLVGMGLSSVLFGIAHTEQGSIGVTIVTMDGIFFSVLRHRYRTLWASVLAHGFNNTLGFIAFFLAGPSHGCW